MINELLQKRVDIAIERLRIFAPPDGVAYWGCFSGGKDSVVIKELARLASVPVEWHYNATTIDPPELVRFIRKHHKDVAFDRPRRSFFAAIASNGMPTRLARWCCKEFKETRNPKDRRLIIGVRWEESSRRAKAWGIVTRNNSGSIVISPIVDWTSDNVWNFIRGSGLPYCLLYDEGFKRLGCIGCPMASKLRKKQFIRWPIYEKLWKQACRRYWESRKAIGAKAGERWMKWEEMWRWWMDEKEESECQGTLEMFS